MQFKLSFGLLWLCYKENKLTRMRSYSTADKIYPKYNCHVYGKKTNYALIIQLDTGLQIYIFIVLATNAVMHISISFEAQLSGLIVSNYDRTNWDAVSAAAFSV